MGEDAPPPAGPSPPAWRAWGIALGRALPPARLVWILLLVLGSYEVYYLGLGASALVVVPLFAAVVDVVFQRVRFPSLRFPDAAIATGLFLALIFPPTASLLLVITCAFAAVAIRHVLRFKGRPWFNPAATGVLLGTVLLGLAPAWWVGIGPYGEFLLVGLGLLLILRVPSSWRLPVMFLAFYGFISLVAHLAVGSTTDPVVLFLTVADPATLFFALFMVPEPRSSPGPNHQKVVFGASVGMAAAVFPLFLPTLGVVVALLFGNLLAVALRRSPAADRSESPQSRVRGAPKRPNRVRYAGDPRPRPTRWPVAYRVAAGAVVIVVLAAAAGTLAPASTSTPIVKIAAPPPHGGGVTAACQTDNSSIPANTLAALHKALGPSVILSYNPNTGVVVFYDPVNQVTVTETDLYEDYGFADFNGDDYAVSGCAG